MKKKIIGPGLLAGLVMLIGSSVLNFIVGFIFPSITAEYHNTAIFRAWSDPLMWIFLIAPFLLGIISAWVWSKTKSLFKGSVARRGSNFGLIYCLISIPGMIYMYSAFQVSLLVTLVWVLGILVQGILGGMALAKLNK